MVKSKAETFLGFCVKAQKIAFGANAIELCKKGVYLLIACSTLSENGKKTAIKLKNKFNCPLIICKNGLENALHKSGVKLVAIKDKSLADAIINNVDENFELYAEGIN